MLISSSPAALMQASASVQKVPADACDVHFPRFAFFTVGSIEAGAEFTRDYSHGSREAAGEIKYCYRVMRSSAAAVGPCSVLLYGPAADLRG